MAILQKAPAKNSPANDEDRYAHLIKAAAAAKEALGSPEAARVMAAGLSSFKSAAEAKLDIRRFWRGISWREPFTAAIDTFLANPTPEQAFRSARSFNPPYPGCWAHETAVLSIVRACLHLAAGDIPTAAADAKLAANRADLSLDFFGDKTIAWNFTDLIKDLPDGPFENHWGKYDDSWRFGYLISELVQINYNNFISGPLLTLAQRPYLRSTMLLAGYAHALDAVISDPR